MGRTTRLRLPCLFAFSRRFWGLVAASTGAAGLGFFFALRPLPSLSDRGDAAGAIAQRQFAVTPKARLFSRSSNIFPECDVNLENAHPSSTSTTRGWETMPALLP